MKIRLEYIQMIILGVLMTFSIKWTYPIWIKYRPEEMIGVLTNIILMPFMIGVTLVLVGILSIFKNINKESKRDEDDKT